jgi:hypothetical protein
MVHSEPSPSASPRRVSLQGPPLTRRIRGSLSVAQITTIARRWVPEWHGQIQEYLVSVEATDDEDAVARVLAVLERHGSFSASATGGPFNA